MCILPLLTQKQQYITFKQVNGIMQV